MKKLSLILFALFTATAYSQDAALDSIALTEVTVTSKVVDEAPAAIVAVPERTSISDEPALSTVEPFESPITVQEKVVSADTAELAVIVNVTDEPSETLEADLVTVYEPPVPPDQAVP